MAGEVLRGETRTIRSGQWISLAFVPVLSALAAAPYPIIFREAYEPGGFGYEAATWYVRAFFVVMALCAAYAAAGLRRPLPGATLEISRDAIHWRSSRGKERTIPRAAVRSTRCSSHFLWFEPATGEKIRELPIIVFGYRSVSGVLQRQGWNVTSEVDPRW